MVHEEILVIRQGEKERLATFVLEDKEPAKPSPIPAPPGEQEPPAETNHQRTWGYVLGAGGLASIGIGSYFGLAAVRHWDERNQLCPDGRCDAAAVDASDRAHREARIADVALGIGLVATALGTYLIITAEGDESTRDGVGVDVGVGVFDRGASGAFVQGAW